MKYTNKQTYLKKDFWRENMMRLLELLEYEELTQHRSLWQFYGITKYSENVIMKEYNKYLTEVNK
jgi:hypothetical protein